MSKACEQAETVVSYTKPSIYMYMYQPHATSTQQCMLHSEAVVSTVSQLLHLSQMIQAFS